MNKDIYAFAKYYFNIYRNPKATNFQVEEGFADKCFSLGFQMDSGNSFCERYPHAFNDAEELDKIIEEIDDPQFLGTAIFSQWIQGGKTDFYYANWTKGRDKGEVDIVWIDDATQKPYSLTEIKWSDRFAENPSELKSLYRFCENNRGNMKVVVTTKTKTSVWKDDDYNIFFIPSSIYAYWVSDYLYKNRKAELLQIAPDAK